MYLRVSMFI